MSGVACDGPEGAIDAALAAVLAADFDAADLALGAAATALTCGDPAPPDTLAKLWIVEGAVRYFTSERDAAREAFAAAWRADADLWIESLGRTVRGERDVAIAEMRPTTVVTVVGVPKGYELWTDGVRGAPPPELPVGPHLVQVTRNGVVVDARLFQLYPGEPVVVGFTLPDPANAPRPVPVTGAAPPELAAGGGAWINFGGTFMTQPPDNKDGDPGLPYNGFAGFSPGFAVGGDVLWRGIVSVELDLLLNHDVAISEFTTGGISYRWRIAQWALHLPLLAKVGTPSGPARPWLAVGSEWVLPTRPKVIVPNWPIETEVAAEAGPYHLWTAGIGVDLFLPVPDLDVRVPITFARASYAPGVPLSAYDRAVYTVDDGELTRILYTAEWEIHASVAVGGWVRRTVVD